MVKTAGVERKGTTRTSGGVPRFDMTTMATDRTKQKTRNTRTVVAPAPAPTAPAPTSSYDGGDVKRLEELIDGVFEKVKSLRLAGMINRDGSDWIQHNLVKCLAILEGMK